MFLYTPLLSITGSNGQEITFRGNLQKENSKTIWLTLAPWKPGQELPKAQDADEQDIDNDSDEQDIKKAIADLDNSKLRLVIVNDFLKNLDDDEKDELIDRMTEMSLNSFGLTAKIAG